MKTALQKSIHISVGLLLLLTFNISVRAESEERAAQTLDKMIEHHSEGIELTRSSKGQSKNDEFTKFFDEMLTEQNQELLKMKEMRSRLFPEIKNRSTTKEKISQFTSNIEEEVKKLEQEMKSAFERFNSSLHKERVSTTTPKVEIQNNKSAYEIKAEIPGMAEDNIKVQIKDNDLVITGSRENETIHTGKTSTLSEFEYGKYERLIHLEDKIDPKSMKVDYKNGILNVHLNKLGQSKMKKI
jgi:HSP20 family protein